MAIAVAVLVLLSALWAAFGGGSVEGDGGPLIVGTIADFGPETVSGEFEGDGVWIVRSSAYDGVDSLFALSSRCPGPSCSTEWDTEARRFSCSCSGSRFAISGVVLDGPSSGALQRLGIERDENGLIRVDPSRSYRGELGQWADPGSFVLVDP